MWLCGMRTTGKNIVMVTQKTDHELVDPVEEGGFPISGPTPKLPHDCLVVVPEEPRGG